MIYFSKDAVERQYLYPCSLLLSKINECSVRFSINLLGAIEGFLLLGLSLLTF